MSRILSRGGVPGQVHPAGPGTRPGPGISPRPGTPPRTRYTPGTRYTHPLGPGIPIPWDQVHPPDQVHPLEQCMPGDPGNKRAVRILLECILVSIEVSSRSIFRIKVIESKLVLLQSLIISRSRLLNILIVSQFIRLGLKAILVFLANFLVKICQYSTK